ncbi:hypothetical protein L3Y34_009768 [Caenorhabditis briggsae]|uniref:ISXO2-like transposase domain-containing protein n=1 Tax=Caenorhabditis briggsae TaxID=6238 RepID=A0AAE9D2B3_CAEBR|nr:hypothetical protein L3Y34_009768 [Caenorhabditis briggsae]
MSAQAALLSLRSFNLFSGWPEVASMTKDEFDDYLAAKGLFWKNRPCPNCHEPRSITHEISESGLHCDRKKFFLFSFLYVTSSMKVEEMARNVEVDPNTCVQWGQWIRDVMAENFNNPAIQIGGVEEDFFLQLAPIDETNIVKRKHNVGRMVRDGWLVGGIQDGTRSVFVEITGRRDQASLEAIITRYVTRGTTIRTDCWGGYNGLAALGYVHETVNHSLNFVNPTTGVHTQRVESLWSQLKKEIKPKCGLRGDNWDDHWFQALWMFKYHEESKFYELWKQISEKYPLN